MIIISDNFEKYGHSHRHLTINKQKFDREWRKSRQRNHNRHHVVHHNNFQQRILSKQTHQHIHLSSLGHKRSHLTIDQQRFDREWRNSRPGHLHENQITEHHVHSRLTIAGHYFKRFHQLGVRLIGRGIVYHHYCK